VTLGRQGLLQLEGAAQDLKAAPLDEHYSILVIVVSATADADVFEQAKGHVEDTAAEIGRKQML